MGIFDQLINLISTNLIKGLFMSVFVIILCREVLKGKLDTDRAISIVRWTMICYSTIILVQFTLVPVILPNSNIYYLSLLERATGPYNFAFWIMTLGAVSPLILFFKKLGHKVYLILALAILLNIGWLMESLVIHISTMQTNYSPITSGYNAYLPFGREVLTILRGILFGVLLIVIGNLSFFKKNMA